MSQPGRIPFLRRNALRGLALATLWAAGALALPGCTAVAFGIANVPALVGNYERHAGLRYAAGPRHSLDVYVPYGAALAPVVVFWYGGAWTSGDKADYRFVGASLAAAGYVVVNARQGIPSPYRRRRRQGESESNRRGAQDGCANGAGRWNLRACGARLLAKPTAAARL